MPDYIKKYQAGGLIDTEKLRQSLEDDDRFYNKGNFTSAGKKRLAAIQEIDKNQRAGITYQVDYESDTFKTVDSEGNHVSVTEGAGKNVDSNSPFYGALSKEKRTRTEISKLIGDAMDNKLFVKPKLEPKYSPSSVEIVPSNEIVGDNEPEITAEKEEKLVPSVTKKEPTKEYKGPDFTQLFRSNFKTEEQTRKELSGDGEAGTGSGEKLEEKSAEDNNVLTNLISDRNKNYIKGIENEIGLHFQAGLYEQLNGSDINISTIKQANDKVKEADEILKKVEKDGPITTDNGDILDLNRALKIANSARENLHNIQVDVLGQKIKDITYFIEKKKEESKGWLYDGSTMADEKAAVESTLSKMQKDWQDKLKAIKDPATTLSFDELKTMFKDLDGISPVSHDFGKGYKPTPYDIKESKSKYMVVPSYYTDQTPVYNIEGESTSSGAGLGNLNPLVWLADSIFKDGGKLIDNNMVEKFQNGNLIDGPITGGDDMFLSNFFSLINGKLANNQYNIARNSNDKSLVEKVDYNRYTNFVEPKLGIDKTVKSNEGLLEEYQVLHNKPKPKTSLLGQTGVNTPIGQVQYNDIVQFILAAIAKNQKIDEIKPFFEKSIDTGSRNVLAARDIDNATLANRPGLRSQYAGSDPVMQMVSQNMTESGKAQMRDQLLSERGQYRRGEEDRVANEMEQKRLQQVANSTESNAVANRNAERAMQYDTLKAQSEQQRKSEHFANLSTIMSDMQGRANIEAAKERDLQMGQSSLEYNNKLEDKSYYEKQRLIALNNGDSESESIYKDKIEEIDNDLLKFKGISVLDDYKNLKNKQSLVRHQ